MDTGSVKDKNMKSSKNKEFDPKNIFGRIVKGGAFEVNPSSDEGKRMSDKLEKNYTFTLLTFHGDDIVYRKIEVTSL